MSDYKFWLGVAFLVVVVLVVYIMRGRIQSVMVNRKGAKFEAAAPPSPDRQNTINGVKITKSERTRVESQGLGTHVKDVEVDDSEDSTVSADGRTKK